jgi:gamma-glutamylcyclotransferase (GGCT)/AIG2-like uncharacterized protein YtfP
MNLYPENNLVFCYGTLKRGFPNHSIMEEINASYIADAKTKFTYPLVLAGKWNTPFMIYIKNYPNSYQVDGELFEIDKQGISILDEFEGTANCYYKRLKIDICWTTEKGNILFRKAWCYFRFEDSSNLLVDPSLFIAFFGKKELKKYTAVHLRPLDWRNK